jgi:hypothetical protein
VGGDVNSKSGKIVYNSWLKPAIQKKHVSTETTNNPIIVPQRMTHTHRIATKR